MNRAATASLPFQHVELGLRFGLAGCRSTAALQEMADRFPDSPAADFAFGLSLAHAADQHGTAG